MARGACDGPRGTCSCVSAPVSAPLVLLTLLLSQPTHTLSSATPNPLSVSNAQGASTETRALNVPAFGSAPAPRVGHASMLANRGLWLLMGFAVLCLAAAVVRIEGASSRKGGGSSKAVGRGRADTQSLLVPEKDELQKLVHLGSCAVALNISMLLWGVSQEFVMSTAYSDAQGNVERVPSTLNVVLWNRLSTFVFSGLLLLLHGNSLCFRGMMMSALPAACNALASWCQYSSLQYISFALQTTAKTTKLAPVIMIDSLRGKPHSTLDYVEVVVLVSALVVFGLEVESSRGGGAMTTMTGVMLLVGLIAADSLTPHCQDAMFTAHPEMNPIQATFAMAGFASVGITLVQLCNGMLFASLSFVARHPEAMLHIGVLALSSTMTQYFITYTIKHHGPVVFTVLVSIRQVLSVGLSAVLFGHSLSGMAVLAIAVVFFMVISRAIRPWTEQDSIKSLPPTDMEPLLGSAIYPLTPPVRPLQWPLAWLSSVLSGRAGYKKFVHPPYDVRMP